MRRDLLRGLFVVAIITGCSSLITFGFNDFAQYWVFSRQLLGAHNPYSLHETLAAEAALGTDGPGVVLNPPWIVPVLLPLGWASYVTAQRIWFATNFAILLLSAELAGKVYAPRLSPFRNWLLIFTFLPAMTCVAVGQMGALILLGIVTFLYFAAREKWSAAGACLFLASSKPQLAYLVWPAIVVWTIADWRRRWALLGSLGALIVLASALAFATDHAIFSQYMTMWLHEKNMAEVFPTFGGALRAIFGRQHRWLQLLPTAGALIWLLWYARRMKPWNWMEITPMLVAASLATAPYGWYFDEIVLWPGMLRVLVQRQWATVAAYILLNGAAVWIMFAHRTTFWYSWTAPAWLVFYVLAAKRAPSAARENVPARTQTPINAAESQHI